MTDTQVTWLTQEAFDRLKAELDQLIANRPVIAAEINDRREEGDLRENGGYHAAREEQGQQEARIRQLQELLNNAKVGEAPKQSGVALPGSVVKVYYNDDKSDTETFLIATRQEGVKNGKLEVSKTPNGENPLVNGATPILGCDVWEHSYYIDYRNRRPDYLKAFLYHLVNWEHVDAMLGKA